MLNVVLDDWVIKWLTVKLGFMIIYVSKLYASPSILDNIY